MLPCRVALKLRSASMQAICVLLTFGPYGHRSRPPNAMLCSRPHTWTPALYMHSPLFGAAMAFGLVANGGSRLSGGQSFLPPALLEGYTPRAIMISLAAFTTVSLFSKLEGKTGHWQDWA